MARRESLQMAGAARPAASRMIAVLEAALLDAAWDELQAVGYADLTMEAVADRAGSSRVFLYRNRPRDRLRAPLRLPSRSRARPAPARASAPDRSRVMTTILKRAADRAKPAPM